MTETRSSDQRAGVTRRAFLGSAAALGAGAVLAGPLRQAWAQAGGGNELRCAIIGSGVQGRVLLRDALRIPGLHFQAVCDIWSYSQTYGVNTIRKANRSAGRTDKPNAYADYREMLAKENDLDAVIIATPDFVHAEHALACLDAGLAVYCEKEMSNDLAAARKMSAAGAKSPRPFQIGHQRRSNPMYLGALELITKHKLCGRITNCFGQWNRSVQPKLTWPGRYEIPAATLKTFGYDSMDHFRNWRWYRKYSAGPIADLGSHQIDIFGWFLGVHAKTVQATGQSDYFPDREWYEDVMCLYRYDTPAGKVQAFYQVLNTNGYGNYFERFQGDAGTIVISEDVRLCRFHPEPGRDLPEPLAALKTVDTDAGKAYKLADVMAAYGSQHARSVEQMAAKSIHQWHLENFFDAVRGRAKLHCPPTDAYPTAVEVLSAIPAIEKAQTIALTEEMYRV